MDKIIVALDVDNEKEALRLAKALYPVIKIFKIGNELFTSCGPSVVNKIHKIGARVFLDLKFHDIPNTVRKAAQAAAKLGVFIFNVHISGGSQMMQAAKEGSLEGAKISKTKPPLIFGVTMLTSLSSEDLIAIGINRSADEHVLSLAALAKESGLSGVVCSPKEIKLLRENLGGEFMILTPGVRPIWADASDHKRIKTPREAIADGANYVVMGRPIIKDENPLNAALKIIKEIEN